MSDPDAPTTIHAPSPTASGQGAPAARPGGERLLAIVLLGPFVGTLVVVLLPFILEGHSGGPLDELPELLLVAAPFGFVSGILPSIIAAFIYFFAYRYLPRFWPRLLGTLTIGAASGALGVLVAYSIIFSSVRLELELVVLPAIAGAVALAATALAFDGKR